MTWEDPAPSRTNASNPMNDALGGAGFSIGTAAVTLGGLLVLVISIIIDMVLTSQFDSQRDANLFKTVTIVRMAGLAMLGVGLFLAGLTGRSAPAGVRAALLAISAFVLISATSGVSSVFSLLRSLPGF